MADFNTMVDLIALSEQNGAENWIQIMKTGSWKHPQYGEINITPADLHQFNDNYHKGVRGTDIAVDVDHNPGAGAVGWFKDMKVDGDKLMAKIQWTEEGATLIKSGKYRYFSPEFVFSYKDAESGKAFKDVLLGGGITNRPFLKNMDPIEFSEGDEYGTFWFAENYDPDDDGDDDETTDPKENPDWILDVLAGITPWPTDADQITKLEKVGATKQSADAAFKIRQKQLGTKGIKQDPPKQMSEPNDPAKVAQDARAKKYGIKPHDGGSITKPSQYKDLSDDDFADPVNYSYPIDSAHALAAYKYFAKPANQSKYSDEEKKIVAKRIVAALPEQHKAEANKTFMFDEDPGTDTVPGDGVKSPEHPINDVDAGKFNDPDEHKKTNSEKEGAKKMSEENKDQVVSLSEYNALQEQVKQMQEKTRRIQLNETVKAFEFNEATKKGKILPAQHDKVLDFMMSLDDEGVKSFSEIIENLPDAISFNEEIGIGGANQQVKSRESMVIEKANELFDTKKVNNYVDAVAMAEKEIPETLK